MSQFYVTPDGGAGAITTTFNTDSGTAQTVANAITISGGDGIVTSGTGSTVTLALDSTARLKPNYVENIGIDYNGGTGVFTVQGADATLSSTNIGYVTLQSKADPGELVSYSITADQNFIDDAGSSEIIGNLFGLTTSVAYGEDIPFFLYAVGNDDEDTIAFMISRNPAASVAPAAANIGAPDDAVADAQADFFSLENIDETLYDGNPCICLGAFRMQMSASDDWTVQTLDNTDGVGKYHEQTWFTMPTGVFGSASGTFWQSNAGTEPTFTTQTAKYKINRSGIVDFIVNLQDCNNSPSGANDLELTLPYASEGIGHKRSLGTFDNDTTGVSSVTIGTHNGTQQKIEEIIFAGTSVTMQNEDFGTDFDYDHIVMFSAFSD